MVSVRSDALRREGREQCVPRSVRYYYYWILEIRFRRKRMFRRYPYVIRLTFVIFIMPRATTFGFARILITFAMRAVLPAPFHRLYLGHRPSIVSTTIIRSDTHRCRIVPHRPRPAPGTIVYAMYCSRRRQPTNPRCVRPIRPIATAASHGE